MNWDDLRYVLAVAETGSVAAAARRLGVTHATVLRRIAAFEEEMGAPVFERLAQGYRLRPDRVHVIEAARDAARAMGEVETLMRGAGPGQGAELRLTSVDTLCLTLLGRGMTRIAKAVAPDRVTLLCANAHLDLARLQADMTVRPAAELPPDMAGEVAMEMAFAVYAAPGVEDGVWLGLSGPLARSRPGRWMAQAVRPDRIVLSADSFVVLRDIARTGAGQAILPRILGDGTPGLIEADAGMPDISVPVWVASHADIAGLPRIQRARAAIVAALRAESRKAAISA